MKQNKAENKTQQQPEITFPRTWEFRMVVMAERAVEAATVVDAIFATYPDAVLAAGEISSSGKYIPFRISVEVESKAEVEQLSAELAAVPGFKLML